MKRFLAATIIGLSFFVASARAADADPKTSCAALIHAMTDSHFAVDSLMNLAQSYHTAFRPQTELAIYKHILEKYRDITSERRLEILIKVGIVSLSQHEFAAGEAAFTDARDLALKEFPGRLIQIYLESSRLYANWGLTKAEKNQEINPAYFQLAKAALQHAQSIALDPAQREAITEAARELDVAMTRGVRLPSGETIATATPTTTEAQKRTGLEKAIRADVLYREAEFWLWSYYDSHDLKADEYSLDTRGLLSRAVSALSQVHALNPKSARGAVYLKLKAIRKNLNRSGLARSIAERQAGELIYQSLFRPWQNSLTEFVSTLKNTDGHLSDANQFDYGGQLFEILIEVPNRIREGIPGSGRQASAPTTAGQMYEALLQAIEGWSPSSPALIDLKQTWLAVLNHELLMTTQIRTNLAPTLTTYR